MQIHNLKPIHKRKPRKRIGRGGKRGTYSGRGVKGQKSRAGTHKSQPAIREVIKRYPKLRGYRSGASPKKEAVVNLSVLEKYFKTGDKVTPKVLLSKGLIGKIKGKMPDVKILATGKLTKKLVFENVKMSKAVEQKLRIKN